MTHRPTRARLDAEGSILAARDVLATIQDRSVPTDLSMACSARAQAIATAAVAQAVLDLADAIRETSR